MDLLKVYISGRVTASRRKRFNPDAPMKSQSQSKSDGFHLRQVHLHGLEVMRTARFAVTGEDPLGLSSDSNLTAKAETTLKPPKKKRGSNGISSRSRQLVKDAATLLQEKYGKSHLAFVTHTIPTPFVAEVHANWTSILHNLRRRYIRSLQKAGLSEELIMVTEYQEDRLSTSGIAVLHLHIVFVGRHRKKHWSYNCEHYKKHWQECCESFIKNAGDNDKWKASTRVESIRKSCSSYLSKYMSKGVSTLACVLNIDASAFIPPSWHVCSQLLRSEVRKLTRHFDKAL